ncbi:hypothetical protein COMNV_01341 [Commensalibacter sp. Nvir]|uniref:hypothetical protein n=1 Tax=Commensalibacter sp. Nvir TaxID=3069817 RepID=UPI002D3D9351|nr:hypothetical protein COMNV_01341 [Commensalibacter sp. Nvir]
MSLSSELYRLISREEEYFSWGEIPNTQIRSATVYYFNPVTDAVELRDTIDNPYYVDADTHTNVSPFTASAHFQLQNRPLLLEMGGTDSASFASDDAVGSWCLSTTVGATANASIFSGHSE